MIRPATTADLAAVLALGRAAFERKEDKPTARWLLGALARPGCTLAVGAVPGLLAGFILTYPVDNPATPVIVKMVCVDARCRKGGVGRLLLATVPAPACTWIRPENTASQALFRSLGWVCRWPDEDGWGRWELVARPHENTNGGTA